MSEPFPTGTIVRSRRGGSVMIVLWSGPCNACGVDGCAFIRLWGVAEGRVVKWLRESSDLYMIL